MGFFDDLLNKEKPGAKSYRSAPLDQAYTPEVISALGPGDVFVFGSNLAGRHLGGAARAAVKNFGAIMGQGEGLQGQSYAIPTMQGGVDTIQPYVDRFIEFAKGRPDLTFYVTKIGCGIAGFSIAEIAPLFKNAVGVKNIRLPKEFADILKQNEEIRQDTLTHGYGVTRTFADVVIALNKEEAFKSPAEVLKALDQYFQRLFNLGDEVAFMAVRTFWSVVHDPEIFAGAKLNVDLLRKRIFDFKNFEGEFDRAYLMYCKEKICNAVTLFNEFRRYTNPDDVIEDLDRSKLTRFSHCGPNDESYLMSPMHAGLGYPRHFFGAFLSQNWNLIAPNGVLEPRLLNEFMFDKHERGTRKYGLPDVIKHDYKPDGACHPEVYFPRSIGTGPVYVKTEDRKFIRSCGEGKGPNSIPNFLEFTMALELLKDDPKYRRAQDCYVPVSDMSLPVYSKWRGKVDFSSEDAKRHFIFLLDHPGSY